MPGSYDDNEVHIITNKMVRKNPFEENNTVIRHVFINCHFEGFTVRRISFTQCEFINCCFIHIRLSRVKFEHCVFSGSLFHALNLRGVEFGEECIWVGSECNERQSVQERTPKEG